jgi:hypothetical protein
MYQGLPKTKRLHRGKAVVPRQKRLYRGPAIVPRLRAETAISRSVISFDFDPLDSLRPVQNRPLTSHPIRRAPDLSLSKVDALLRAGFSRVTRGWRHKFRTDRVFYGVG